jgi:hypothetical protein
MDSTRFLLIAAASALVGCASTDTKDTRDDAPAPPSATVDGTWSSPRGVVHLSEQAGAVTGEYICTGTIEGTVNGNAIEILWMSPDGGGKGSWRIQDDGRLTGTWTYGPEDKAGGSWDLTPRKPPTAPDVTGSYESDFGPVHLQQAGVELRGTYECPGGTVVGTREGDEIRHAWQGSDSMGHGVWQVTEGGDGLVGRWGFGPSATEGGEWNLKRQAATKPTVAQAEPDDGSSMHSGKLLEKITARHDSFRRCLNEALEAKSDYPDRLNITITIEPSGSVSAVGVEPTLEGRRFDACLHEEIAGWSFDAFEGEAWTRTFPYVFAAPPAESH